MGFRSAFDWMNPEQPVGRDGPNRKDDVARVESLLDHAGHLKIDKTVLPDGKYRARTDRALRAFQSDYGLKVNGLVNPGGPTIRRLVDNTFRDNPKVPPPKPGPAAAGSRAGPGSQLSKVRTPAPQRGALLAPLARPLTPSAAPHAGGRQMPPKPVVQPARKTRGLAPGSGDYALAGNYPVDVPWAWI